MSAPVKKRLSLKLRKFSFDMMKKTETIAVIAKRGCGKTVLLKDLLYHFRDIPIGTIISPTEKLNKAYGKIVPPIFIHDNYREEVIERVLKRQKHIINSMDTDPNFANVDPHAFLLLDDCMYNDDWQKSINMREIFYQGRHYKLMFLLSLQYCMGLKIGMRNNLDWTFLFKESIMANKKRLYEYFAGMFPNQAVFSAVLDSCTMDFGALVIHNGASSTILQDQVFWYKAEDRPCDGSWRTCLDTFWDLSESRDSQNQEDEEEDDFDRPFYGNHNSLQVNVRKQS